MQLQAVTIDEVRAILALTDNPHHHLLIEMFWITGGRCSEVLLLKPKQVGDSFIVMKNLKQRTKVTVNGTVKVLKPHNAEKQVSVPLQFIGRLADYIKEYGVTPNQFVFSGLADRSRPYSRIHIYRIIKNACERASVLKVNRYGKIVPAWPHCFRHGNATRLYEISHDIMLVKEQLGHARVDTTQIYIEVNRESKQRSVEEAF